MNELTREVITIAEQCVGYFEDPERWKLDYSEESLAVVEESLAEAADFIDPEDEENLARYAEGFGCYILEVGRRNVGGHYSWFDAREQPVLVAGAPAFRVAMITWDRVKERLLGDAAAAIPFFYEGFATRARNAQPGDDVLYV